MSGDWLPKGSLLGELELLEIYDWYDGPTMFSVKNDRDVLFFVFWADSSENIDAWLYAPISPERLRDLESCVIDVRSALENPEGGIVYRLVTDGTRVVSYSCLEASEISKELPPPEEKLIYH